MKGISILICISVFTLITLSSEAKTEDIDSLFLEFAKLYTSGDFVNAEETLFLILKSKETLKENQLVAVYNNLGVINISLGRYDKALEYNNLAESLILNKDQSSKDLADIYTNKGYIYNVKKSFDRAVEYFEKSIRIYLNLNTQDEKILSSLSSVYINLGIAYLETGDYTSALDYFKKSAEIKLKHNFQGVALVYLNIAKTFVKTGQPSEAEEFYVKSINRFTIDFNEDYYRLADVYFDYGLFLRNERRNPEALEAHRKALSICLKNYGGKHPFVALAYKHLGDHYMTLAEYRTALDYYQKSLIAVVSDFNNNDIYSNPTIDSSLFDIRLLDNLKSKATALELYANEQNDQEAKLKTINKSLETIELALNLVDTIRNNYLTEDSRIYLAENEKETYLAAVHIASELNKMTGKNSAENKIYSIAQKAKATVLRSEITESELFFSTGIPDSIREKKNRLTGNIAAYAGLILEESRKTSPDTNKIALWKDALFEMNREKEKITSEINREFPLYSELIRKTEPLPLSVIQKHLERDETVVDYLLSNCYENGKRSLYIFSITRDNLIFHETTLDSLFLKNAEIIRNTGQHSGNNKFREYTGALVYMYGHLVKPVEEHFVGNKLIIIPDEEITWLPFDAFLRNAPRPDEKDYEGLQYMLYKYAVSYGYSSSLIFSKSFRIGRGEKVLSFAPDYSFSDGSRNDFNTLRGTDSEIESIYRWFRGKKFTGTLATETNFRHALKENAVFHLAMHSISDTTDSRYSFMLFDTHNDQLEDGKLFNYEISLTKIKSPMVVLSACNSGAGKLYHGEGLMSLARGFILAGASSVIRTAWEVNDEISADIISGFYKQLSEGKDKDDALRLAKINYLKTSPPAYTGPYFWAAYEVLGDNAPIAKRFSTSVLVILTLSLVIAGAILIFYLRRRRIFSERSL